MSVIYFSFLFHLVATATTKRKKKINKRYSNIIYKSNAGFLGAAQSRKRSCNLQLFDFHRMIGK